jgi:hypothetical protein
MNLRRLQKRLKARTAGLTKNVLPEKPEVLGLVGGITLSEESGGLALGGATSTDWGDVTSKPSTFAPSAHAHPLSDISQSAATTGQIPSWSGSAWVPITPLSGGSVTSVTGTGTASGLSLSGTVTTSGNLTLSGAVTWADVSGKPATFPPEAHTQAWSTITTTPTTLAGYGITDAAAVSHGHANASVSVAGFMSATDKTKLDGVATSANLYVHPNHSGDVTSAADGATTIANDVVTNAKLANMAANSIKGNNTGSAADPIDMTVAQTKTLLAIAAGDVSGLGTLATQSGTFSGTSSGTNTGDNAVNTLYSGLVSNATHTGDVTGATALTIANDAVSYAKMQNVSAASRLLGRGDSGAGDPQEITLGANLTMTGTTLAATGGGATNLTYTAATRVIASDTGTDATLPLVTTGDAGLAPASGGGTANFLRADATWAAPPSGGSITYAEAALAANVQLTTTGTFYDGPSVSLAAGTWIVFGYITVTRNATTAATYTGRIDSGGSTVASTQLSVVSLNPHSGNLALQAVVVLGSTTTVKLTATSSAGTTSTNMRAATNTYGGGDNATRIIAVRLA